MAIQKPSSDAKPFRLCPFWSSVNAQNQSEGNAQKSSKTVSSVARSLLPPRRRLCLDPSNHLYFPYEPGKQVRSAVRLKNTSKSHVAFKFQTTAPKSCYMRPPGGILAPGETLIATVFKFVEQPENNEKFSDQKNKVKFKIMSLKVKEGVDYVPELLAAPLETLERAAGELQIKKRTHIGMDLQFEVEEVEAFVKQPDGSVFSWCK